MISSSIQAELRIILMEKVKKQEKIYCLVMVKKQVQKFLFIDFLMYLVNGADLIIIVLVATFCHNIAHDLPIQVNDPSVLMNLVYIDDVVNELINALEGK
jgi:UDP-2-acetamido-2,6-beta-L-arabino-hexul-4-ose reductase